MLDIRRQNGMRNQMKKTDHTGHCRASAVLLAAVTALSPLSVSVRGAMLNGFLPVTGMPAVMAADADSTEASTAEEPAASAATTAAESAVETAGPAEASTAEEPVASAAATAAESAEQTAAPVESTAADSSGSSGGREIYVHLADAPQDPVPSKVMDTDTASLLKLISEGLVVLDENNKPAPGCAESWEVSKDGLKWTFHLRDNLKWSDGFSMKASDFVLLFRKTADTSTEALYGSQLTQNIAGYEDVLNGDVSALQVHAPDDRTFVVELTTPDPDFARTCASWSLLPIREQIKEDFDGDVTSDWNSVTGNGPYYVDSVTYEKEFILKKNPYYRQADSEAETSGDTDADQSTDMAGTAFDTVHWILDGDINEEYSDFLNGGIDAISAIPEEEERLLETEKLIQQKTLPDTMGICFNCRHEVLGDARVRRALSMAVDRTFIASTVLQDVYLPQGGDGLNDQGDLEDHIPEAKELLEKAGYKDGKGIPTLTCIAEEKGGALLTAEYLASAWRDLGINVRVEAENAEDLAQEKTAGTFDIFCGSIFLASDLPAAELANFTTDHENNVSGFSLEKYDLLIEEASEMSDEEDYAKALEKAFDILREEMPVVPLVTRCVSWLRKDEYPGITCDSTGCWQLKDIQPEYAVNRMANDGLSGNRDASDDAFPAENQDGGGTENGTASLSGSRNGNRMKEVSVTAQMPAGKSAAVQAGNPKTLPQIGLPESPGAAESAGSTGEAEAGGASGSYGTGVSSETVRAERQGSTKAATGLDLIRQSDAYFERTNQQAYLTRQAWVYDAVGENAQRIISLPKYSEVHLTGTGNSRLVRITQDGKSCYLESNRVSPDIGVIDRIHEEEREELAEKAILTASLHSVKENELQDRAADVRAKTDEILAAIAHREMIRTQTRNPNWNGPVLSRGRGSVMGPSGKETYYNLNMSGVVNIMRRMGNMDEYWVRDDGCKMLGDYIMCAANLGVHPRGSLVECSLGTCIVCDTGGFASGNPHQLDIAVTW